MDRAGSKLLDVVFNLCLHHPKKIMSFWIVAALSCAYWAQDLPNYCIFNYLPPEGTPSAVAFSEISTYFPKFLFQDFEVIVMQTLPGHNIISDETELLLHSINDTLWHDINRDYGILVSYSTFFDADIDANSAVYPLYKERFVSADNTTMISFLSLSINGVDQDVINGFITALQSKLSSIQSMKSVQSVAKYKTLTLTGPMTMWYQAMTEMQDDMTSKDMVMMPFIFALIMYVVGSWKFVCVVGPVLGMVIVLSLSSFLPFAIYHVLEVNPMAPSIMLFLSMALSVDYSMFLISRFTSEIRKGATVQVAVREMLRYSAHVVVLSGSVLLICYLGVTFFPVSGMDTVGYGAVVTIFYSVIINISFTASSILAFPNFYGSLEVLPSCCYRIFSCCCTKPSLTAKHRRDSERYMSSDTLLNIQQPTQNDSPKHKASNTSSSLVPASSAADTSEASSYTDSQQNDITAYNMILNSNGSKPRKQKSVYIRNVRCHEGAQNCYFRLAQTTTKSPYKYLIPLVVYGLMCPVIYLLVTRYQYAVDFTYFLPTGSTSVQAWNLMSSRFSPSILMPYYILAKTQHNTTIWNDPFFSSMCDITNNVMSEFDIPSYNFHSIAFSPEISTLNPPNISSNNIFCFDTSFTYKNTSVSLVPALEALYENVSHVPDTFRNVSYLSYLSSAETYLHSLVSDSQTASVISFLVPFNPLLQSAVEPSRRLRAVVDAANANQTLHANAQFYLHNSLYWQIDSLDVTDKKMPWMLSVIVGGIFLMIGLMFKSVFLPIRLLFAVVIPIAFVYGVCVSVYVLGALDWMGWSSVESGEGIIWMAPCLTITILMGLAMDYEIFLFSRVFEYRHKGYTTRAAIVLAVANTGPIISSAGTVMAMAFFGMLLQNIVSSNQMGFLFVVGVLIDTFVVRPLLVPPILSLIDVLNWWPTKVPMDGLLDEYGKEVE